MEQAPWFSLFRFRSPLLTESRLMSVPQGTEMFHFPWYCLPRLCVQRGIAGQTPAGLPHSEILGSMRACRSPRLIAAYHVLHRLLVPRHPSCARIRLTERKPSFSVYVAIPGLCNCQRTVPPRRRIHVLAGQSPRQIVWTRASHPVPHHSGGRAWNRTRDLILIRDAL